MKKLFAIVAIASSAGFSVPAFADSSASASASASTSVSSSTDLPCMKAAVDARESAVVDARTKFNAAVLAALQVRAGSLSKAWTETDSKQRNADIKAALKVYADAAAKARLDYQTSVKAAWSTFVTASAKCHPAKTDQDEVKEEKNEKNEDKKEHKQDRGEVNMKLNGKAGLGLGIGKGLGLGVRAKGEQSLDLSF